MSETNDDCSAISASPSSPGCWWSKGMCPGGMLLVVLVVPVVMVWWGCIYSFLGVSSPES